jgi:hypothetical protein
VAKTWVLNTETKGTGAHVAPLKPEQPRPERDLAIVTLERPTGRTEDTPAPPATPAPHAFKVVDVMGARVLAEGVGARETLELLAGMRSVTEVRIYVWVDGAERWRLLTLGEQKALWGMRGRVDDEGRVPVPDPEREPA